VEDLEMAHTETTQVYRTDPGRKWQDWANAILAIWLFISPWVISFGQAPAVPAGGATVAGTSIGGVAAWNAWILAVIVFLVALSAMGRLSLAQEWLNLLLGIWIFVAPWVLGFVQLSGAAWDHWIVGALIILVSASAALMARRALAPPPPPPPV
jgi:hypothetical protein